MSVTTALLLLFVGAGILLSAYLYLRVEPRVGGRPFLLVLRIGTLGLLGLILMNPVVPRSESDATGFPGTSWFLLDPDLSLAADDHAAGSLWDVASHRARAAARAGTALALLGPPGTGPEGVDTLTLRGRSPVHPTDDAREGVVRLAESGADTVRLVGTFRWAPGALDRLRESTPVPLVLERIGGPVRNAGVARLDLPGSARQGEPVEGRVVVFHEATVAGDSAELEIRAEGRLVESRRVGLPAARGTMELELALPAPPDTGWVRYSARIRLPGDGFPQDDERVRRVRVGDPEGGILLVSLRPDWEVRALLPVLEAVTGLEGEGFLRLGEERFLTLAAADRPAESVSPEAIRDRISTAQMLVLHGVAEDVPAWLRAAVADHRRVLHLPAGPGGAELGGLTVGQPRAGEWIVDAELPPSPIAPFLQGIPLGGLPPLSQVMAMDEAATVDDAPWILALAAWSPGAPRSGVAASEPILVLVDGPSGRHAVALATGFWRWGVRTGEPRRAYRSLWGGVSDWLLALSGAVPGDEVRPVALEQPRGRSLEWTVSTTLEEVTLEIREDSPDPPEAPAHHGSLVPDEDGRASSPSLAPGIYRYEARSVRSLTGDTVISRGEVEVEAWAPSLMLPPLDVPERIVPRDRSGHGPGVGRPGRRVRTYALPYLLILLFLSAEWVGRRRVGLR